MLGLKLEDLDVLHDVERAFSARQLNILFSDKLPALRLKIAHKLQENILLGIEVGRPEWPPLSVVTQRIKGHSKPLEESGDLKRAIQVTDTKDRVFVGIPSGLKREDGTPMEVVAGVHENGATIEVTDRTRAFFASAGFPLRSSTKVLVIPARPFLEPALRETEEQIGEIVEEFADQVVRELEG